MRSRCPRGCPCPFQSATAQKRLAVTVLSHATVTECGRGGPGERARGRLIYKWSGHGTGNIVEIGIPDNPIRVKVSRFFTATTAAPEKEKDEKGGSKGGNASNSSTNNRTSIVALRARRDGWDEDIGRLYGCSNFQTTGIC